MPLGGGASWLGNPEGRLPKPRLVVTLGNNVQRLREDQLLSKAELARRAGVSSLTIDRIEAGRDCRLDTKRKIILGLGLTLAERRKVFGTPSASGPRSNGHPRQVADGKGRF